MTKQKSTKQALFVSTVSLLLCITMLIGTTFAWFTDTVTNGVNKIVSGNLDVELWHSTYTQSLADLGVGYGYSETNGEEVKSDTALFLNQEGKAILWEPGAEAVENFRIKNEGSLALKYMFKLEVANATKNPEGKDLTDIIMLSMDEIGLDNQGNPTKTSIVSGKKLGDGYVIEGEILPEKYYDFSLGLEWVPSDRDNEFNLEGGLELGLGITLLATQLTYEKDDVNGDQYDKDATLDFHPVATADELRMALANKKENIVLTKNIETAEAYTVDYDVVINGDGKEISRADGYTGTIFKVKEGKTLTLENVVVDGGAVWASRSTNLVTGENNGIKATADLITAEKNSHIILNKDAILQNNDGAYAVNLGTRIGATLTLNGAQIINNRSGAGAIWGGGHITINEGSKISYNSSTGPAGAIRMVSNCNLTMNGGEISHNTAATDGGAIWGYGSSTYNFNGGEMAYNTAGGTGGAIYSGTYSVYNFGEGFELHDNSAANSGAIRFTDHASLTMTGGKVYNNTQNGVSNAFNTWNNSFTITGGEISDNISYVGGLGFTLGEAEIDGVVAFDLSTNHNTAYLKADFGTINFTADESAANFANFNFKPAADYVYTEGDEAKLVCKNEGYETYWDTATNTFRLRAI